MLVVNKFHFISMALTPGAKAIICGFFNKIGEHFLDTVKPKNQKNTIQYLGIEEI